MLRNRNISKNSRYTPKYIRYTRALHTITTVYLTVFLCRLSFHPDTSDSLKMIQFTRDTGGPCIDNVDRQRQCVLFIRMLHITICVTAAYQFMFIKLQLIGYQAGRDLWTLQTSNVRVGVPSLCHISLWCISLSAPRYNSLASGCQFMCTKVQLTGIRLPVNLHHGTTHWYQVSSLSIARYNSLASGWHRPQV